jgi:hypothetical protein
MYLKAWTRRTGSSKKIQPFVRISRRYDLTKMDCFSLLYRLPPSTFHPDVGIPRWALCFAPHFSSAFLYIFFTSTTTRALLYHRTYVYTRVPRVLGRSSDPVATRIVAPFVIPQSLPRG